MLLKHLKRAGAIVALVSAAMVGAGGAGASADIADDRGEARTTKVTKGMTVVGFDRAVAEANGYEIVTLPDGTQASVKKGEMTAAGSTTLYGNCGHSYVELYNGSGVGQADFRTGFYTSIPAISYRWWVVVRDNNGTSNRNYGGGLSWQSNWTSGWQTLWLYPGGNAWATVMPEDSWALTTAGTICVSAGPGTVEYID